jgi:polar amino acid transport system permease protein
MSLDFVFMRAILPEMIAAAILTAQISATTLLLTISPALCLTACKLLGPRPFRLLIRLYIGICRGVPPLVLIAAVYFLLPRAGLLIDEFWTGVLALTVMAGGYVIAIIEGAVVAINFRQRETALALGLTELQALVLVIAPQAFKRMLPPMANEIANLIKASALLSIISVKELTKVSRDLIFEHFVVVEVMIELTILYLAIISLPMLAARYLEKWVRS